MILVNGAYKLDLLNNDTEK